MDIGYAKLPVPSGAQAPTTPGDLAQLAQAIDPHLLHHVVDQAQRDSEFASAPLHTFVTAEDGSLWVKTSAKSNTWATIWEPPPAWRPLPLASGMTAGSPSPQILREGRHVYLRGRITKGDGGLFTPGTGIKVADVPSDCIPTVLASITVSSSLAGDITIGTGRLEVYDPDTKNANGEGGSLVWFSQEPPGTPWIAVDGHYII